MTGALTALPVVLNEWPAIRIYADLWHAAAIVGHAVLPWMLVFLIIGVLSYALARLIVSAASAPGGSKALRIAVANRAADWVLLALAVAMGLRFGILWLEQSLGTRLSPPFPVWVVLWALVMLALAALLRVPAVLRAIRATEARLWRATLVASVALVTITLTYLGYAKRSDSSEATRNGDKSLTSVAQPDIILVVLDTLSADHVSSLGYWRNTTPHLDAFAADATLFADVTSSANYTTAGVAAIMTGKHGHRNGIFSLQDTLPAVEAAASIPAQLQRRGYQTAAFIGNNWAHPAHLGIEDYFDAAPPPIMRWPDGWPYLIPTLDSTINAMGLWEAFWLPVRTSVNRLPGRQRTNPYPAEPVFDAARRFMAQRADDRPLFLWIQVFPPHGPYLPPDPHVRSYLASEAMTTLGEQIKFSNLYYESHQQPHIDQLRDRYDEHIRYVDEALGRFLESLRTSGLDRRAVIVVTSDHGESFDKGFSGHNGWPLHQGLIGVPLAVRLPGQTEGRTIHEPVQLVDIAPTLLDFGGIPVAAGLDGRSLRPALEGRNFEAPGPRFAATLYDSPRTGPITRGNIAVIDGGHKLVWDVGRNQSFLYDLERDPRERVDLARTRPDDVRRLQAIIRREVLERRSADQRAQ